jgi:transcription elongation factor GreB
MSRAFVKEQDGPELLTRPVPELPPGTPNYITPGGDAGFRSRLEAVRRGRSALGDQGLDIARRAELDAEARWLEGRIATFVVTSPPSTPRRVGFGVRVQLSGRGGPREVRLVGVDEVDAAAGDVSWLSPIARALHAAEVGDEVLLRTPGGEELVEVLALRAGA